MDTTDIRFYKSKAVSDEAANGGLISFAAPVASGVKNAVFPRVTSGERAAGKVRYRKLFLADRNSSNETLSDVKIGLLSQSPADDVFYIAPVTAYNDTQAEAEGIASWYGAGTVNSSVTAGSASVTLLFEDSGFGTDFSYLYLTDGENYEIAEAEAASFSGNVLTVTLTAGLAYAYSTGDRAAMLISLGNLETSKFQNTLSSAAGSINTAYMTLNNLGCVSDTFTFTFASASSFTVSGVNTGMLAGGSAGSVYAPLNSVTGQPLFSINPSFWVGAWAAGDYVKIDTAGSYAGFWIKEAVPAGAGYEPDNSVNIIWAAD